MDLHKELGVKGYCFRAFSKNTAVAESVRACGLDRIDLSGPQVNFKDFTFSAEGGHRDVIIGEGGLDLAQFISGLQQMSFHGPAVIEYEGDRNNPVPALIECVNKIRSAISQIKQVEKRD